MRAGRRELRCNEQRRRVLLAVHRATDLGCLHYFKSGVRTWRWVRLSGSTRLKDTVVIQPDSGGKDVFVHISAVEKTGFSGLAEGAKVSYDVVANRGKESAENLRVG